MGEETLVGVGGWVKETIDRDLPKYLESRQMKEGCDSGAEIRSGGGEIGEKKWDSQAVGKQLQTNSPKRLLLYNFFLINFLKDIVSI